MDHNLTSLPAGFVARLKKILTPDHFTQYQTLFAAEKPTSFRINTLLTKSDSLITAMQQEGFSPQPIDWCKEGYYVPWQQRSALIESTFFAQGLIYIQNAASLYASLVLDPKPEEEVLDLAAAPGGKTLHMAALMQNKGRIAAVEAVKPRFFKLKANIKRSGATLIQTYLKDGRFVGKLVPNRFDKVLLDAPCSSEARLNLTHSSGSIYWSEKKIKEMSRKQKRLILSAIQALKPNGILAYCTCSFAPEENEMVVQYALDQYKDQLEILSIIPPFINYQSGLTAWEEHHFSAEMVKAIRIIPTSLMSGFFLCLLRKREIPKKPYV